METVRYLVTGFPGAFAECHRWLVKVTFGLWPFLPLPGTKAWVELQYLRNIES